MNRTNNPPLRFANTSVICICVAFLAAATAAADEAGGVDPKERSVQETSAIHAEIAESIAPSVVQVAYTLRYDGTDTPTSRGWNERCPSCGGFHGDRVEPILKDERPLERAGFAISPTEIVTGHVLIHPRFIESIKVTFNGETVEARPGAYALGQRAVVLDLDEPLAGVEPLAFGAEDEGALFFATVQESRGRWTTSVRPFSGTVLMRDDGSKRLSALPDSVIVNASGEAAGISMTEELDIEGGWKATPADWERIDASELESLLAAQGDRVAKQFPRVSLRFRSPREDPTQHRYSRMMHGGYGSDDEPATEKEAIGLLLDNERVLILANLSVSTTARLERIRVHLSGQDAPVEARFVASLSDYGALVAELEEPAGSVTISEQAIEALPAHLLLATELKVSGEQLDARHEPARIADLKKGRRGVLLPDLAGEASNLFLFDLEGGLVALPIEVRERAVGERQRWRSPDRILAPASLLKGVVDDIDTHGDPANVPLDPDEEGRLAWVGVEIQPLDRGLARDLQVAIQTDNGETGALVTHVYPDSPAAEAGIESGDVLLRMVAEGIPQTFPVKLEQDYYGGEPFPWEHLDEIPAEYFDHLPMPWTSVANSFNQFLTELGFGRTVRIDGMRDGEPMDHELEVIKGPAHYEAAPQHRSDGFGVTVRELTYETRRFFQKEDDAPGLIIARIEPGSAAATGGLKPYELITHVNGEPVLTVEEFEQAAETGEELRLSLQRMHQGRIAVIRKTEGR